MERIVFNRFVWLAANQSKMDRNLWQLEAVEYSFRNQEIFVANEICSIFLYLLESLKSALSLSLSSKELEVWLTLLFTILWKKYYLMYCRRNHKNQQELAYKQGSNRIQANQLAKPPPPPPYLNTTYQSPTAILLLGENYNLQQSN